MQRKNKMTLEVTDKNLNNNNFNFWEQETKKEIKKALLNNLTNYETEKLGDLRASIAELVKTLEIIEEYIKKADKLWITVDKDFSFEDIYHDWWFDFNDWETDFNDLKKKCTNYSFSLQRAVRDCKEPNRRHATNMSEHEKEKLIGLRKKFDKLVSLLDKISEYLPKADKLWIYVKKDFQFNKIYHEGWFDHDRWRFNFKKLRQKFLDYAEELKTRVEEKEWTNQ